MKNPKKSDDLSLECLLIGRPPKKKASRDIKDFIICNESHAVTESKKDKVFTTKSGRPKR